MAKLFARWGFRFLVAKLQLGNASALSAPADLLPSRHLANGRVEKGASRFHQIKPVIGGYAARFGAFAILLAATKERANFTKRNKT